MERMIKSPPWLFSAESDVYKLPEALHTRPEKWPGDRITARYWSATPRPTSLVHFVCSRWPGSDGRKIGMRLLRRWFLADIEWVTETRHGHPLAVSATRQRPLIGFSSVLPLGDRYRDPSARCSHQRSQDRPEWAAPCNMRAKPNVPSMKHAEHDRRMMETWHGLLSILALVTDRTAVLPLFQCIGFLDPRSRNGWTIYSNASKFDGKEAERAACTFRLGEGCFQKLGFPEELLALPPQQKAVVKLTEALLREHGVKGVVERVANASRGAPAASAASGEPPPPVGIELDVSEIATRVSEDDLVSLVRAFTATEKPHAWSRRARAFSESLRAAGAARRLQETERGVGGNGRRGGGGRARGALGGLRGLRAAGGGRGGGRGGRDGGGGGRGVGHGGGRGGSAARKGVPLSDRWQSFKSRAFGSGSGGSASGRWQAQIGAHTCPAWLKISGQPYVC